MSNVEFICSPSRTQCLFIYRYLVFSRLDTSYTVFINFTIGFELKLITLIAPISGGIYCRSMPLHSFKYYILRRPYIEYPTLY